MKKSIIYTSITLLIVIFAGCGCSSNAILRQSAEEIEEMILEELTPVGMNMEDAIKVIEYNDYWQIEEWVFERGMSENFIDYYDGFRRRDSWTDVGIDVGEMAIGVELRYVVGLSTVAVYIYWGFDENSELIDVHVQKSRIPF